MFDSLKAKFKPTLRPKSGFKEAQKASLSAVSSRSNVATGSEAGLEKPLEVLLSFGVECRVDADREPNRFRNIKSNLAQASGIKHTMISATRKGNLSKHTRRY
jgi:hypothetical protein